MIKLVDILKEIGDANFQPYEYSYDGSNHRAYFTTEYDTKYKVSFKIVDGRMLIAFGVIYDSDYDDDDDLDYEVITNKGNIYRVMSTVMSIINRAISEFNPNEIKFDSNDRKIKLYKNYIEKHLKGYNITKETPFNLLFQRNNPIS
jgi:hypothetical protein